MSLMKAASYYVRTASYAYCNMYVLFVRPKKPFETNQFDRKSAHHSMKAARGATLQQQYGLQYVV